MKISKTQWVSVYTVDSRRWKHTLKDLNALRGIWEKLSRQSLSQILQKQ